MPAATLIGPELSRAKGKVAETTAALCDYLACSWWEQQLCSVTSDPPKRAAENINAQRWKRVSPPLVARDVLRCRSASEPNLQLCPRHAGLLPDSVPPTCGPAWKPIIISVPIKVTLMSGMGWALPRWSSFLLCLCVCFSPMVRKDGSLQPINPGGAGGFWVS